MIRKIVKLIPTKYLIFLWKKVPFPMGFKNYLVWCANSRFLVAVLGVIENDKKQILLLKHTYRKYPWGVPSGWIEHEDPYLALEREVLEETGFKIKCDKVVHVRYTPNPNRIDIILKGRLIDGSFKPSAEVSEYGFFNIGDWPEGISKEQQLFIEEALLKIEQ